jgi:antitoxin Phd
MGIILTEVKIMLVDTKRILSVTEVNQNFSKAARLAEKNGSAVIFKNNRPRYMLIDLNAGSVIDLTTTKKST